MLIHSEAIEDNRSPQHKIFRKKIGETRRDLLKRITTFKKSNKVKIVAVCFLKRTVRSTKYKVYFLVKNEKL